MAEEGLAANLHMDRVIAVRVLGGENLTDSPHLGRAHARASCCFLRTGEKSPLNPKVRHLVLWPQSLFRAEASPLRSICLEGEWVPSVWCGGEITALRPLSYFVVRFMCVLPGTITCSLQTSDTCRPNPPACGWGAASPAPQQTRGPARALRGAGWRVRLGLPGTSVQ